MYGCLVVLIAVAGLQGCAGMLQAPRDDPSARAMVLELSDRNSGLVQFKGLMEIRLEAGGTTLAGRAGWASRIPDQLRIEWLSMLGQPVFSLAADGRTLTLVSYTERHYRRLPQTASALSELIKLPVTVEDLVMLLSGRPLLPAFEAARFENGRIVLKDRWHRTLVALTLDESNQLQTEQLYTRQGALRYEIEWRQFQTIDQITAPRQMVLTADTGERVSIKVVRFWPDASLEPSAFFLEEPEFVDE